jgi:hypothetical protein
MTIEEVVDNEASEVSFDNTLDNNIETWKETTNSKLKVVIGNRSKTKTVIKDARREAALLQHECRLEEDWDLVGEIRSYLRSIRTLEFGLKGNRG